jgi:predicted component of type VI protein secretion system
MVGTFYVRCRGGRMLRFDRDSLQLHNARSPGGGPRYVTWNCIMKLKLKVIGGKHAGQEISVPTSKPFLFGRGEDCQLRAGSELVSRHHCVLMIDGESIFVRDLASRNGTFVNGQRVTGESEIANGDELAVGPLKFTLCVLADAAVSVDVAANKLATRSGDVDVSQWLNDDTAQAAALMETQCMRSSDTRAIPPATVPQAEPPAEQPAAPVDAAERLRQLRPKGEVGKLPPIPQKITADSRDAAAQMLQKLRRRN